MMKKRHKIKTERDAGGQQATASWSLGGVARRWLQQDLLVFKHDTGLAFVNIGMLLTASMSVLAKFEQVSRALVDPSQ